MTVGEILRAFVYAPTSAHVRVQRSYELAGAQRAIRACYVELDAGSDADRRQIACRLLFAVWRLDPSGLAARRVVIRGGSECVLSLWARGVPDA